VVNNFIKKVKIWRLSYYLIVCLLGGWLTTASTYAAEPQLLAIYLLAFDNQPTSTANLTSQYQPVIESLRQSTVNNPNKTVVALADLDSDQDTHILVIQNGKMSAVSGLPNNQATLDRNLQEYDMSNGETIGYFIQWARTHYPADKTLLTFIGHGAPLVPETDLINLFQESTPIAQTPDVVPLPHRHGLNSNFTDHHPLGLISPFDLAQALRIGTADGANPITVLDLVHCFSASIEQLYELHPYAEVMTGSANYTYVSPDMLGMGLTRLEPTMTAQVLADTLIRTYNEALPDSEHPRIFVAVDSNKLPAVKKAWDSTAHYLHQALKQEPAKARNLITSAYLGSAKYDTTFCTPQDWDLNSPDALSDMGEFANKLAARFGESTSVGQWAKYTEQKLYQAIIAQYRNTGQPWFAKVDNKPTWHFTGSGVALYTDFQPMFTRNQRAYLSLQSQWYTDTVTARNPHPYTFIDGGITWADVLAEFWADQPTGTASCLLPQFPQAQDEGEITVLRFTAPDIQLAGTLSVDAPVRPAVVLKTSTIVDNPLVQFRVWQSNTVVYTNTVNTGYLITGTHEVEVSQSWMPKSSGSVILEVMVDADNRILEQDETDNIANLNTEILPKQNRPTLTGQVAQGWQWVSTKAVPIELVQTSGQVTATVTDILVQLYQYESGITPLVQSPEKRYEHKYKAVNLNSLTVTLPPIIQPGTVIAYLWGITADGAMSIEPVVLSFNYAPTQTSLSPGNEHYYTFSANSGEQYQFLVAVGTQQDANLFAWLPHQYQTPTWQAIDQGDDTLTLNPIPYAGSYLLSVRGETGGAYTLTVYRNGKLEGTVQSAHYLPLITQ